MNGGKSLLVALVMGLVCVRAAHAQESVDILGGPYVPEVDIRTYKTPTRQVKDHEYPVFNDDYDMKNLKLALQRQLKRFSTIQLNGTIMMGGKKYPLSKVEQSLQVFEGLVDTFTACVVREAKARCYADLNKSIRDKFNVFAPALKSSDPRFGQEDFAMFTGYNTYHIEGRLQPEGEFQHAIYAFPADPKLNGATRVAIDFDHALSNHGLELVYVKSLFDIYEMHIEGSGKISVPNPDGSMRDFYLQYDKSNRQRFEFISLYMAKAGYITNGSIPSQRKFLRLNPDKQREIYGHCPSYIYLKPTNEIPKGSGMVPVTDGRTIAQDNATYPFKGLLAYIESRRPAENGNYDMEEENKDNVQFVPFSRFVLDQDTGGKIKGKARADIYFGSDDYAMFATMYQAEVGKIHFLLLK